jgi:hypothetical protein
MFNKQQQNEVKVVFHGSFPQGDPCGILRAFSQIRPVKDGEIQAYTFLVSQVRVSLTKVFREVAIHFRIDPRSGNHRFVEYLPPGNGQLGHIFSIHTYTWQWDKGTWMNDSPVFSTVSPRQQAEFEQLIEMRPPLWISLHQDNPLKGERVNKEPFAVEGERYSIVWNEKGACIILPDGEYLKLGHLIVCFPKPQIALQCMEQAKPQVVIREETEQQKLLPEKARTLP